MPSNTFIKYHDCCHFCSTQSAIGSERGTKQSREDERMELTFEPREALGYSSLQILQHVYEL